VLALRGPGVRVNASGVPQSLLHWKSESVGLWRLLGGPVSASLPNSLESPRHGAADQPPFRPPRRCRRLAARGSKGRNDPLRPFAPQVPIHFARSTIGEHRP
jgi:hypothetical protein